MRYFALDISACRDQFATSGWARAPGATSPELLGELRALLARARDDDALQGAGLAGAKEQFLFETPDMDGFCSELFDMVSAVCGTSRSTMTLSERHLKVYDRDADPEPLPHKDRLASQVAVGISIEIPTASRLVVYPDDDLTVNRLLTPGHLDSLPPDQRPERTLRDARPVEIADRPGDITMFRGASMWHLRRSSAGAALLYLKCNDFDCDPLGEDPSTPRRRERTLEVLAGAGTDGAGALRDLVPMPARRLQSVSREYGRDGTEATWLTIFGRPPAPITELQHQLLRAMDGRRTFGALVGDDSDAASALRALAEREAVDLLEEPVGSAAVP